MRLSPALLLILACRTSVTDRDQDGVPDLQDCRPDDARSFPGAPERCDNLDNDCDGTVDDGLATAWYVDVDGDGWGDGAREVITCAPPLGAASRGGDCDDHESRAYPTALERCDGLDNDCDGRTDEPRTYLDFEPGFDETETVLVGSAAIVEDDEGFGKVARLTRPTAGETGSLWVQDDLPGEGFAVRVRMRFARSGGELGEGLALAFISGDVPSVEDGGDGPELGIYGTTSAGFTVELDPYQNSVLDGPLPGRHVAVQDLTTNEVLTAVAPPVFFDDGTWHDVEVTLRGPLLDVTIDGRVTVPQRILPLTLGPLATLGFSAATSRDRQATILVDEILVGCPGLRFDPGDTAEE